jgi:hypothetical protein
LKKRFDDDTYWISTSEIISIPLYEKDIITLNKLNLDLTKKNYKIKTKLEIDGISKKNIFKEINHYMKHTVIKVTSSKF